MEGVACLGDSHAYSRALRVTKVFNERAQHRREQEQSKIWQDRVSKDDEWSFSNALSCRWSGLLQRLWNSEALRCACVVLDHGNGNQHFNLLVILLYTVPFHNHNVTLRPKLVRSTGWNELLTWRRKSERTSRLHPSPASSAYCECKRKCMYAEAPREREATTGPRPLSASLWY